MPISEQRLLSAALLAAIALLSIQVLAFGYGRDQAIYAVVAREVLAGGMPYRDAWDFKPPGIFLFYVLARGLFGGAQIGIRIVEVLGLVLMVAGLVRLSRRFWGEPVIGLIAGVLALLDHAQFDFWHTAQPESFAGMLTVLALVVLNPSDLLAAPAEAAPLEPVDTWRWGACAALFGFCGLLKPPLAGGALVVALLIARRRLARGDGLARGLLLPVAVFFAGGCLPLAAVLLWFWSRGALSDLFETLFVFAPRYTALSWEGADLPGMAWQGLFVWLQSISGSALLGLLLLAVFARRGAERRGLGIVLGILALHFAGVLMQGKFFTYHYGASVPLVALLAALGLFEAWRRLRHLRGWGPAVFLIMCLVSALLPQANRHYEDAFGTRCLKRARLIASGLRDLRLADELSTAFGVDAGANRAAAAYVAAHTPRDRPILVWGFEPVIYDWAERGLATRYVYDVPQRSAWSRADSQALMLGELCARPPSAIVVEHEDRMSWVTGSWEDSAESLPAFPALARWLAASYRLDSALQGFDVYLERAPPPAGVCPS